MKPKPLFPLILIVALSLTLTAVLVYAARAASSPDSNPEVRVVRAYFDDPAQVAPVATWTEPWEVNIEQGYVVVEVTAAERQRLIAAGFRVEEDEKLTYARNHPRQALPGQVTGIPGYPCYRTVEETYATAEQIVNAYPQLATWIDIGDSWEKTQPGGLPGYDMMVLRLTNEAVPGPKPKLFVMNAIHAREYTTAELGARFAEYLIEQYGADPDVTWMLDYNEVHLLLQSNPDGRKKAEAGLSWRKNTNESYCSPTSNSRGADLNRNYPFEWGNWGGSSGFECDPTYRGPSPASEPETQAVVNYVGSQYPDLRAGSLSAPAPITTTGLFLDIHSYGELVLWPWGLTNSPSPNFTALQTLGRRFAYFNQYDPDQAYQLYPTDGTTDGFAYGELGLPAYAFELGTSFFQGCTTFESEIYPDNLEALLYATRITRAPYLVPAGPDALTVMGPAEAVVAGTSVTLTATIDDRRFYDPDGTEPSEPTQNIAAAEYYVDTPPWVTTTLPISYTMTAADGVFDNKVEDVRAVVDTTGLDSGRHILFVRGQDSSGQWGPVSASFLYVVDPAVAPVIQGNVRDAATNSPLAATVTIGDYFTTATDPVTGFYSTHVISGTYDAIANAAGYAPQVIAGVVAQDQQTTTVDFELYPVCDIFSDDMEAGGQEWTADFPWALTTETAHTPTHSWTDSPGGNYGNNRNVALTSPLLDLSDVSGVTLSFWQICDTEAGWDYCHVEVSGDGGATWDGVASFDGPGSDWQEVTLSVPQLDGQTNARVRFRLQSDTLITADGWHLDDVRVSGGGPGCVAGPVAPSAAFVSNSPVALGDAVAFTNTSTGTDLAFLWDFGDGSAIVTETHPNHTYGAAGAYTVVLTATNTLGSSTTHDEVLVLAAPSAQFTVTMPITAGLPATFTNTSTGTDLAFTWDFGDGSPLSHEEHPVHVFALPGSYAVTLTAANAVGSSTETQTVVVHAGGNSSLHHLPLIRS